MQLNGITLKVTNIVSELQRGIKDQSRINKRTHTLLTFPKGAFHIEIINTHGKICKGNCYCQR